MSVISRLDAQVEAVLINPLRRPGAPGVAKDEPTAAAATVATPASASAERAPQISTEEREPAPAALPVWLL